MSQRHCSLTLLSRRVFLLSKAHSLPLRSIKSYYDEELQINVVTRQNQIHPLVSEDKFGYTSSKTESAPGDDDPDPEDEGCY